MKNTILSIATVFSMAGAASAAELGGSVGFEIIENAAGKYVAETTLGFGVTADTGVGGNLTVDGTTINLQKDK